MDTCCLDDKSFRLVGTATTSAPCQTLTRTYEVADCAGNTSQCTQVIQVKELVLSIDDTYVGRPGNWVTVQIKAKNCNPLQQLVFAVQFAPWLQYVPGSVTGVPTRVTATPAVEDLGGGTLLISLDSPSGGMVLNDSMSPRGEVFMSLTFRIGALTSLPASTPLTVVGNVFYATGMNGLEVCHDEDNGLLTVTTCFWLLDVDQNGTVDSNDGLWIYNVFKYHLITNPILNQKPVIPTDTPNRSLLPTDAQLIAYVVALIGCEDMDVDNDSSILATRDGVYFYRWLRYHGTSATVPADHTSNLPFETLISNAIKALELTQRCPQNLYDIPCVPPGPGPTP